MKIFISYGCNIHIRSDDGNSAITLASYKGLTSMVSLLIDNHAMIDDANYEWTTPILEAAACGHVDVVQLLISNKANIKRPDKVNRLLD